MSSRPTSAAARPGPELYALQRLYVFWAVSTVLLIVLLGILTVLVSGHLSRQAAALNRHEQELADLRSRLLFAAHEPSSRPAASAPAAGPAVERRVPGGSNGHAPEPPSTAPEAAPGTTPSSSPATQAITISTEAGRGNADVVDPTADRSLLTEPAVAEALERVLIARDDRSDPVLLEPAAAARLLDAVGDGQRWGQSWNGRTWSRLALLAALLGRDAQADVMAYHAARGGFVPRAYLERLVALQLRAGRADLALATARRLGPRERLTPRSKVALVAALAAGREWAEADELALEVSTAEGMPAAERLLLADALIRLDRWEAASAHAAALDPLPAELEAAAQRLNGIAAIQRRDYATALAVFDALLTAAPGDADLRLWRAVAQLRAGRYADARLALAELSSPAAAEPKGPTAPVASGPAASAPAASAPAATLSSAELDYWRGVLELADGRAAAARDHLSAALAADPRHFLACESLAALALNEDRLDEATELSKQAVEVHPRRAPAQFLLALVYARRGHAEPCAAALRQAFALDRELRPAAGQAEAIAALFTPAELDALLPPASGE